MNFAAYLVLGAACVSLACAYQIQTETCADLTTCEGSDSTCCKFSDNTGHGCCPYANGICCEDGYCCPSGTTCNSKDRSCDQSLSSPLKFPSNSTFGKLSVDSVCPDKKSQCTSNETCCKLTAGGYGCCPYEGAVCCNDHIHCCPHGSKCDIKQGRCARKQTKLRLQTKTEKKSAYKKRNSTIKSLTIVKHSSFANTSLSTICPGGSEQCPDLNTCCKLKDGEWGCCPLPGANCCTDQVHCCPDGYDCVPTGCKKKKSRFV
jgi:hypothetical protein